MTKLHIETLPDHRRVGMNHELDENTHKIVRNLEIDGIEAICERDSPRGVSSTELTFQTGKPENLQRTAQNMAGSLISHLDIEPDFKA
jgi:hypothetical protein